MKDDPTRLNPSFFAIGFPVFFISLIGLCGGYLGWKSWRSSSIADNERRAATALKTLTSAEADFRANDRDGNGVNDFWTGDVAGLYKLGLIERGVAEADVRPLTAMAPKPVPYHGYFFIVMNHSDEDTPTENLQLETDKTSGKVHHREKFGFCAFPAEFGVTGRTTFIVNQNNTILFERHNGQFTDYWPSDEELRHDWAKGD